MRLSKNQLKKYRSLKQKKFRDKEELFVIEGKKIVNEVIQFFPHLIENIVCTENIFPELPIEVSSKISITDFETLSTISSLSTPQEVIAIISKQKSPTPNKSENDLTLALDNVSDPGNLGTIIRMADWFGVKDIYCSENCVDCFNPKVVQATMGSIFRVNVYYTNLPQFLSNAVQENITLYGTTLDGENIYNESIRSPSILVMGNESTGISEEIKKIIDRNVLIPNFSENEITSESLNVSTATAIALSEIRRQQFYSK